MPRLEYPLSLALVLLSFAAHGQELAPVVIPVPPMAAADVELGSQLAEPAYPNYRCDGWECCRQWWCATWYTRVELLALIRDHDPQNQSVVQTAGGDSVFNINEIDFELSPGISTLVGHRIDGMTAVELSYFGANQWNEERAVGTNPASLRLPGDLGASLDAFNNTFSMEISLRSQMHNAEINYLRDLTTVSLLAGFRYFNWQEQLNIHAIDSDFEENDYNIRLSNNLVGGQLGVRMARYWHGLDLDFTGKAGIFGNQATQSQRITVLNGTAPFRDTAATEGVVSFLGDLNLSASCPLTSFWRVRGGYNLLFASSIAVAANQLDFSANPTSGQRVRQDSDVFLHGFNVGLEAIW